MSNSGSVGILNGLKVVECGEGISAAFATKLMADLGADVIKVEEPSGDIIRRRRRRPPHSFESAAHKVYQPIRTVTRA